MTLHEIQAEVEKLGWVIGVEHLHREREGSLDEANNEGFAENDEIPFGDKQTRVSMEG